MQASAGNRHHLIVWVVMGIFLWRKPAVSRMFGRTRGTMADPTATVLSAAFVTALLVAVAGAIIRGQSLRPAGPEPELETDPESPFAPPHATTPVPPAVGIPLWIYRPTDLLGAGFVFLVFAMLALGNAGATPETISAPSPGALLVSIAFQFIMASIVLATVAGRIHPVDWLGLRWPSWPWLLLIAPCSVLAMWAVFGGLHYSGYVEWMESLGAETTQDTVRLLQDSQDPLILGLMAVAAVIAAPLCEEIVFRGYLYPVLKRHTGMWPAAIASSLVFACAHGNLTAALPLFLFGALLVLLYEKTGSLWTPIAAHLCFNGATVLIQFGSRLLGIPSQGAS
jgi:membrane protease YdiL (CAAX protease family)